MRFTKLAVAIAASGGVAALALFAAGPAVAQTSGATSYQANLQALNNSGASGTLMLTLNGDQATITEHASGLAATFSGNPYPHVQHIHIDAKGQCPTTAADTSGDGVIFPVRCWSNWLPTRSKMRTRRVSVRSSSRTSASGTCPNAAPTRRLSITRASLRSAPRR